MLDTSIDAAINHLVAEAVAAALAPYKVSLDRLQAFLGDAPARRGPGRPRKASAAAKKPARRAPRAKRGSAKKALELAQKFSVGDVVTYNQGRFGAKVVELDGPTGSLVLERLSDGKRVLRPAGKVEAADVAPAVEHDVPKGPKKATKKASRARAPKVNLASRKSAAADAKAAAKAERKAAQKRARRAKKVRLARRAARKPAEGAPE